MITQSKAIQNSLERYCYDKEIAIASGDGQQFQSYYLGENIPYFDVQDETYWLVDPSEVQEEKSEGATDPLQIDPSAYRPSPVDSPSSGPVEVSKEPLTEIKQFKSICIKGKIDVANYHQVFSSFIMPLKDNNVEIEIRIKGKSNAGAPITEQSPSYKIVKESAKQLGLDFEEED